MQQKFNVGIVTFSYGGNGGISSEVPDIREWMVPLVVEASRDERIDNIRVWNLSDTPITMTRNRAVLQARQMGVDVLLMVDSDMKPDINAGNQDAKPFFQSSFDFLVNHYHKGPCVIGAPYCGPPPVECVYVFRWQNMQSEHPNPDFQLEMYDRHTAVKLAGIQECAALPTGLIMYDMRAFELTEPQTQEDKPWFYYEWKDKYAAEKSSTEDVTQTRDLSLVGTQKLGYNPVYCNWDAWAGHWKPKCVGKPQVIAAVDVSEKLKHCWTAQYDPDVKLNDLPAPSWLQAHATPSTPLIGMDKYVALSDGPYGKMKWLSVLMDSVPRGPFLEIGVREGGSLLLAAEHPNSTVAIGVDPYGGAPYLLPGGGVTTEYDDAMCNRMLARLRDSHASHKAQHKKMTSDEYMKDDPVSKYSYVYLDGSHEADVVAREMAHFIPRLAPGGVLAVDDTETLGEAMLQQFSRHGNMAFYRKPAQ